MPGTPDVECMVGWIELKWARSWPKRGGAFRVPHFTPQQRIWLRRRWNAGGGSWLLLQIGLCWMLFDGPTAADILGHCGENRLRACALKVWDKGLVDLELRAELQRTERGVYSDG